MGNTFIVSESGKAFMNFGDYKPGSSRGVGNYRDPRPGRNSNPYAAPGTYAADIPMQAAQDVVDPVVEANDVVGAVVEKNNVFNPPFVEKQREETTSVTDATTGITTVTKTLVPVIKDGQPVYVRSNDPQAAPALVPVYDKDGQRVYVPTADPTVAPSLVPRYDSNGQPIYVSSTDPAASQTLVPRYDKNGQPVYVAGKDPNKFSYPQNSLYGYLEAVIESSSAKTLASPTLLVQEGQAAKVETGTSVITGVKATETANGSTQFENTRENAGLTLDVNVDKIDDNGFVTMNIAPTISIPEEAGMQQGVPIFNITGRSLSSGRVRLRDRQTLVLTGVIRETDFARVQKWPILGDLPILGQLFRQSFSGKDKQELVILVTPSIVDDEAGGAYGYGYTPSTREARQLMGPR